MKRRIALLSILITLTGCLIAIYITVLHWLPGETSASQASTDEVEVFSFDAPISAIRVCPPNGAPYTLIRLSGSSGEEALNTILAGHEELRIRTDNTSYLFDTARRLEATMIVYEQFDDSAVFGLDSPQATTTITDVKGVSKTLMIGDSSPDGLNHYVQVQGESLIYYVPSHRLFYYLHMSAASYIDTQVTFGVCDALAQAQEIRLSGAVRENFGDIVITPVSDSEKRTEGITHMLRSPLTIPVDSESGVDILLSLNSLVAESIVEIDPGEEQIAAYSLDPPYAIAEIKSKSGIGDYKLVSSEPDSLGWIYLMREGIPLIYRVMAADMLWLDKQFYDLMDRRIFSLYPENYEEITASIEAMDYTVRLDRSNSADAKALLNGLAIKADQYAALTDSIQSAFFDEYTTDFPPTGVDPYLRITYRYRSGEFEKTFSFYPGPSRKYFIEADDMPYHFYTYSFRVDNILDTLAAAVRDS